MVGMGIRRILYKSEMEKSLGMLPLGGTQGGAVLKWTWQK
jgi:hypothetical protein